MDRLGSVPAGVGRPATYRPQGPVGRAHPQHDLRAPIGVDAMPQGHPMSQLLSVPALSDVILRHELIDAGYTDRAIARLVRDGTLVKLRHGSYIASAEWALADEVGRVRLLTRAVLRRSIADVVASHSSAMAEYDGPTWGLPTGVTHLTRLDAHAGRRQAGVVQHQGLLLPGDVVRRNGIPVTSPARTGIDITTITEVEAALVAVNHLLHSGLVSKRELWTRYSTMAHDPHTLTTDLVLRLADGRIESVGESRTFFVLWRHGLPIPVPQWVVFDALGQQLARLDFAWPDRKRWIEFDGVQKYVKLLREGETVTDVVLREKRREDQVREATDWRCLRVTWADHANQVRLASRIRAFLG